MKLIFLIVLSGWLAVPVFAQSATKPPRATVGKIDFRSTPIWAVAGYLGQNLVHKPVLIGWEANCRVSAATGKDLTVEEAIPWVEAAIESNGCHAWTVGVDQDRAGLSGATQDVPHVELAIEDGAVSIDRVPIALEQLGEHVRKLKSRPEVWIFDYDFSPPILLASTKPTTAQKVVAALEPFDHQKLFRVTLTARDKAAVPVARVIVTGTRGVQFAVRAVDEAGHERKVPTQTADGPMVAVHNVDYASCELKRIAGTGSLKVEVFHRTNLLVAATLPEDGQVLTLQKEAAGWTQQVSTTAVTSVESEAAEMVELSYDQDPAGKKRLTWSVPVAVLRSQPGWDPLMHEVPLSAHEAVKIAVAWLHEHELGTTATNLATATLQPYRNTWYYYITFARRPNQSWANPKYVIVLLDRTVVGPQQVSATNLTSHADVDEPRPVNTNAVQRRPFRREPDDGTNQPSAGGVRAGMKGSYETVEAKVLRVFAVEDNGAKFRAYLVKWKDVEVIVSDPLARSEKKEGDLITFMVSRSEYLRGEEKTSLLHFVIMSLGDRSK